MNARQIGFTLIEIMVTLAIIAILGAIAVFGYGHYTARAGAADLISRHHDIRTAVIANAATRSTDNCAELVKGYDGSKLADPFASLTFGFEAVAGGYRPVLAVCAIAAQSGGVAVARRAYESFAKEGLVEKNPVLTDTVVSFALRLTPADQAPCKTAPAAIATACASGPTQVAVSPVPAQAAAVQVAAQPPAQTAAPQTCPAGQEVVTTTRGGNAQQSCAPVCPAGQRRNTGNNQCVPDNTQPRPPTVQSLTQAVAQVPAAQIPARSPAQQAAVTAAVQNLIQGLSQTTSADDALARTIAAAQALPADVLTQSVPANTPQAKAVLARCPALRFGQRPCSDMLRPGDDCSKHFTSAQLTECVPATVCPKSAGLCQGVAPEMRALLDASWQRMRGL